MRRKSRGRPFQGPAEDDWRRQVEDYKAGARGDDREPQVTLPEAVFWLEANWSQIVRSMMTVLRVPKHEVLRRLGLTWQQLDALKRRPTRRARADAEPPVWADVDRDALLTALRHHDGELVAVARETGILRSALPAYVERLPRHAWIYGPRINERHGALLAASAVSREVATARGYASVPGGLIVPLWNVHGVRVWAQTRVDEPRGPRWRYVNPRGAAPIVDVSPRALPLVLDASRRLYVTESPRKADAAVSLGLACVAFPGIRMSCLDVEVWTHVGVGGREVVIAFDSDVAVKRDVGAAERELRLFLTGLGARVGVVRLPGREIGLDDYLAGGRTEADLLALCR